MSIEKRLFGKYGGESVYAYRLTNKNGSYVTILNYGGIIQSLVVPDKNGKPGDVVCGFDTLEDYIADRASYTGSLIGRCGNRISRGGFNIGKEHYSVANNEGGRAHLHGGNVGFNRKIWNVRVKPGNGFDSLYLSLFSPDMEEGYPGNLDVRVRYTFADDNSLEIRYEARTDADTYINLTNHAYFNLNGYDGGSVMDQKLRIDADLYDDVDENLIPYDKPVSVAGTDFDFRKLRKIATPYDHNFHIRGVSKKGELRHGVSYYDPASGRTLDVYTDLPCVQLYTAGGMNGPTDFKGGVPQRKLHALCLETQNAPDLPNRKSLRQRFTKAGKKYRSVTKYVFGTEK